MSIRFGLRDLTSVKELKTHYQILHYTNISFAVINILSVPKKPDMQEGRIMKKDADMAIYINLAKRPILIWILETVIWSGPETQQKCHDMNRKRKCGHNEVKRIR